ncbi:hypothetical protein KQI86_09240 [Clostridium sp. MSJ-11]|uniref:Uncharacterized protein n=1 Tax=Clostridium mobile TaxID=2841512 RepID=A0ABS6EHL7_9CLOT|nr:hypothetical protein [Clostridium mobile]MBU5484513.1 hypothetical protein [Clostridium mobile]
MNNNTENFSKSVHRAGRITVILALTCFLMLPIVLALYYKADVDMAKVIANTAPIFITFAAAGICEILSFSPIIGAGGVYLGCITGNLSNLKLPAALSAMEVTGCEPGTEKGDVLAIIAIAASSIVTVVIVFLGMLFLGSLIEPLFNNPYIQPAFNNLIPALFGSIMAPFIIKSKKESILPIVLPIIFLIIVSRGKYATIQGYVMPIFILISMAYSYWLNKDLFKNTKSTKNTSQNV